MIPPCRQPLAAIPIASPQQSGLGAASVVPSITTAAPRWRLECRLLATPPSRCWTFDAGSLHTCSTVYLLIYAFEGAIRYGLYSIGKDNVILVRDGLIVGPLALLLVAQAFRLRVHPAFAVFAGIVVLHGAIASVQSAHHAAGDLRRQTAGQRPVRVHRRTATDPALAAHLCCSCPGMGGLGGRRRAGQVRLHLSMDGSGDACRRHPGGCLARLGHR